MKRNPFTFLRIVTCIALLALLGGRILTSGPTINLLLFLLLVVFWFVPTLLLNAVQAKTSNIRVFNNVLLLCAVLDAYVLLMATAEAAADIWSKPFLLLGVYVFLAGLLGGMAIGACSAIFGFCGLINGWLIPLGELQLPMVLYGAGTSVAGFVCGSTWRLILPMMVHTAQQGMPQPSAPETPAEPKDEMLAGMEARLREITTERDHAQERLRQLEAQQTASAPPPPADKPAVIEPPPKAKPPAPASEPLTPQSYLQQMEAELASLQAEKTALAAERPNLQTEIARLSDELMAAVLPPAAANPQESPANTAPA